MLIGVCGGVVSGKPIDGAQFVAVTSGTCPNVGVGLFVRLLACTDTIVAMDDCEFDLAGLPGRTEKVGAGEGCEGGGGAVEAFDNDGDTMLVGGGIGVVLAEKLASVVEIVG